MTQSSPSVGCTTTGNEVPQCHVVIEDEKRDLVLLKTVTLAMLEQLSERVDSPTTSLLTQSLLLTKTSTSGRSQASDDPGPRCCRPVVLHWAHGVTAFLLLVGTVYLIGRGQPHLDPRTQGVEEPTEREEFEGMVGTLALICLWMAFLLILRITCRYSFPVQRLEEQV